jgi:hypothetical protein
MTISAWAACAKPRCKAHKHKAARVPQRRDLVVTLLQRRADKSKPRSRQLAKTRLGAMLRAGVWQLEIGKWLNTPNRRHASCKSAAGMQPTRDGD